MKILSKVINLKRHNPQQSDREDFLDSVPSSDTKLLVNETSEIDPSESDSSQLARQNDSALTNNSGEIVKWSPAMESMLEEPPSNLPLQLIAGGVVFCLSFFIWAWFGQVEKTGKAQGRLVPKGDSYKIESLESAKVSSIAVKEGEQVKAGQKIAELDSGQQAREVARLEKMLSSNQAELDRKRHLLEKVKIEANTRQVIAQADVQAQRSALDSAISQSKAIAQMLAQRESGLAAYSNRQQNVSDLSELDRQKLAQIKSELADHQQRLARLKPLAEQGAISQEFIFQAQQAERQAKQQLIDSKVGNISSVNEQIFQSERALREMESQITQSRGELVSAQKENERLQAELTNKIAQQQQVKLEAQQKIEQLKLEIDRAEGQIAETKNLLASAKDRLQKRSLIAPVAGTVLSFNVANTGEVVQPGQTVAEIAPYGAPLVLSALLPNREAGFVEPGMTAQVKLDAYSYQDYGVIPGKVVSVSSNTIIDQKLGEGYRVKIELERNYITEDLKKILFKPGQTATAEIVIRRVRIIDVLLDPIKKIEKDGINL